VINSTKQIMDPGILANPTYLFEWLHAFYPMICGLFPFLEDCLQWDKESSQSDIPEGKQL